MRADETDVFLIYGDEYRREHLRYVSNFWPIFERGTLLVTPDHEPVLLVGPEGYHVAEEMSIWRDIRIVHEMEMAYVPEQIAYSGATDPSTVGDVVTAVLGSTKPRRVKICGMDAMSVVTYNAICSALAGASIESGDSVIYGMRLVKSPTEVAVLAKAWEICDAGYAAFLDSDIVGMTEIQAASIAEKAARDAGAESIVFSVMGSGERTNTVIGRATDKVIREGEMIMYALAIQYEGYVATNEWPFVAGGKPRQEQLDVLRHLVKAEAVGIEMIKHGVAAREVIAAIREYFRENGLTEYDLYPPIHGNGLAEAESPYPDENSSYIFERGMGINFDVSLFNIPGIGSNRIEEGFIVQDDGLQALSPLISTLREDFLERYG